VHPPSPVPAGHCAHRAVRPPERDDKLRRVADPSIRELADKVDDLSRLVARQSGALGQLADARRRPGLDVALLVDLHALRGDALAAASATRSGRERGAFEAIAIGLERLLAGRGGALVVPRPGHPFSAATMEAAEEVACADASLDRTVATLLAPGLEADGRTVRPARVAVHRYAAQPVVAEPEPVPEPVPVPEPEPVAEPEPGRPARTGRARVNGQKLSRATQPAPAAEPEPVRKARPARRAQQADRPQPEPVVEPVATEPATEERPEAPAAPVKRAARKQPARKAQPTTR
jgi:molecular chaperone GrpE